MSRTRLVPCAIIILVSSVSGCMSQAKYRYDTEKAPDGRTVGVAIEIPERTDSWPHHYLTAAKAEGQKKLGGEVEEDKQDPKQMLANSRSRTASNGNIIVVYRLKQAPKMNQMIGQQQPARQPNTGQVMQAGALGVQPPVGQPISPYPPVGAPKTQPDYNPPNSAYPSSNGFPPSNGFPNSPAFPAGPTGR